MEELLLDIRAAELDLDQGLALYPDLVEALTYWRDKCGERFAPTRQDIDPVDIPALLPRVMLADVEWRGDAPVDFLYRLSGTGICDVHGFDLTALRPHDLRPAAYGEMVFGHYCIAVERREPLAHVLVLQTNRVQRSYARIILPLSADGERVTMLMMVDSEKQNDLHEFLEVIEVYGKPS